MSIEPGKWYWIQEQIGIYAPVRVIGPDTFFKRPDLWETLTRHATVLVVPGVSLERELTDSELAALRGKEGK